MKKILLLSFLSVLVHIHTGPLSSKDQKTLYKSAIQTITPRIDDTKRLLKVQNDQLHGYIEETYWQHGICNPLVLLRFYKATYQKNIQDINTLQEAELKREKELQEIDILLTKCRTKSKILHARNPRAHGKNVLFHIINTLKSKQKMLLSEKKELSDLKKDTYSLQTDITELENILHNKEYLEKKLIGLLNGRHNLLTHKQFTGKK